MCPARLNLPEIDSSLRVVQADFWRINGSREQDRCHLFRMRRQTRDVLTQWLEDASPRLYGFSRFFS